MGAVFYFFSRGIDTIEQMLALPEVLFSLRKQVGITNHSCCCILKLLFNQHI